MLVKKLLPAVAWEVLWEFALWLAWGDREAAEDVVTWIFFAVFLLGLFVLARAGYRFVWSGSSLIRQDPAAPFQGAQERRDMEEVERRRAEEVDRMERHTQALNENTGRMERHTQALNEHTKAVREKGDPPK